MRARLFWRLLITAIVATVVSFTIPVFVDRQEYAQAVVNVAKNPSPENQVTLKAEQTKNRAVALGVHLIATVTIFGLINAGYVFLNRRSGSRRT